MSAPYQKLPSWIEYAIIPLINLTVAFLIAGLVVLIVGESPLKAASLLFYGAFGYGEGFGYTLYYTTNFIFAGLAVATAFHAGLFNIGGEGQAYIGGLGATIACLAFDHILPWWLTFPIAIILSGIFGALWALIPGYLQVKRGSHIVITTIMFNLIAFSLMNYLIINVFKVTGSMAAESRSFVEGGQVPKMDIIMSLIGIDIGYAPLNITFILALVVAFIMWKVIWHTKLGYALRTQGFSPKAARYAGINEVHIVVIAMLISGALAGLLSLNNLMGDQHRLQLEFVAGAGYVGIAVALMGRNHPFGIVLAALLFGVLYQGGAEIAFEMPNVSRDMVVLIQGLVILFAGALEHMFRPSVTKAYQTLHAKSSKTVEEAN